MRIGAKSYISPATIVEQVRNTAPFLAVPRVEDGARLIECVGFLDVLARGEALQQSPLDDEPMREDYFALCMAAHHATVATFVPTDVDTKIRGLLWRDARRADSLERMFRFAQRAMAWSITGISTRATTLAGVGPVSGHNGEQLSVLAAALGSFLHLGVNGLAEEAAAAIDTELRREAAEFQQAIQTRGCELDALRTAASLTHNAGDLDQGISFWPTSQHHREWQEKFGRLAHENVRPYDGAYHTAALVYKAAMACEGHRHYPLRAIRALRQSPDLLLPLGPFLDDWGALVARHPALTDEDRVETLGALLAGSRKIPGQRGYYRAICGMMNALGGSIEALAKRLPKTARDDWKNSETRKLVSVPRVSFESMMRKLLASSLPGGHR
ncbi:MAG: hypothetical protein ABI972_25120 [Acidobacteriota bacterium]